MTSSSTKPILLSLFLLFLLSCEKDNDPPNTGDFHHEEFFSDSPGDEVTITVNGIEFPCMRVGDLYIFQEDIVFTQHQLDNNGSLKGVGLSATNRYWEFANVYYPIP